MTTIELGLDTFGDVTADADGRLLPHGRVLRDVVAEAELADQVGVDFFGVGEHHRPDFAISAPEVLLAAIAGRTERVKLGTAVTVLSSDDPVRVYERFATIICPLSLLWAALFLLSNIFSAAAALRFAMDSLPSTNCLSVCRFALCGFSSKPD